MRNTSGGGFPGLVRPEKPPLLICPNTFEYFFIYYEAVRSRWNPKRFGMKYWIIAAALIWIFIKLPQEYWIHVAQIDVTDFVKETIFGVPATATFMEAFAAEPWVRVVALWIIAVIAFILWRLSKRLPPADHGWQFEAGPLTASVDELHERLAIANKGGWFGQGLLEKIILIGFVSFIFAQILPNVRVSNVTLILEVAVVVAVNALFSQWLVRRRIGWESPIQHFLAMLGANVAIALLMIWLLPVTGGEVNVANTLFFLLLITLIVTLYDRYRPVHEARLAHGDSPAR